MAFVSLILLSEPPPFEALDIKLPVSDLACSLRIRSLEDVEERLLGLGYSKFQKVFAGTKSKFALCVESEGGEFEVPFVFDFIHVENRQLEIAALFSIIFSMLKDCDIIYLLVFDEGSLSADVTYVRHTTSEFISAVIDREAFWKGVARFEQRSGSLASQHAPENFLYEIRLPEQRKKLRQRRSP